LIPSINPFIHGRALTASEFIGRRAALRNVMSCIATRQSVVLVGQPHFGKTSLLNYLLQQRGQTGSATRSPVDVLSYIDVHALGDVTGPSGFWEHALAPLAAIEIDVPAEHKSRIDAALAVARAEQYSTFRLESVFDTLSRAGLRLVLLMDEFDVCLTQPALNRADFYGTLRTLASRCAGLVLVLAARRYIEQLNELTQECSPTGSPFFNVYTPVILGPLSERELSELLTRAGDSFDERDRAFVARISGRQPYLAQAAAAALWDAVDEGATGVDRYREAGSAMYRQVRHHFADTWKYWSNATRKGVTAVALVETPRLLNQHSFDVSALENDITDYSPELASVAEMGLLRTDERGDWVVAQGAFLWWLADEIRRNVRDDVEFRAWLHAQEMEGVMTHQQQQRLTAAARVVMTALGKGATTLIEAVAKGFGEGTAKALL